jgi:hypothetical protein
MKKLLLVCVFLLPGLQTQASPQVANSAKTNSLMPFLSYQDFKSLTRQKQIIYIKLVQKYVQDLTSNKHQFANVSEKTIFASMVRLFEREAQAQNAEMCLSSGFIIAKVNSDCPRIQQLPEEMRWSSDDDLSEFSCKNEEHLCNPFLYGFLKRDCKKAESSNESSKTICVLVPVCVTKTDPNAYCFLRSKTSSQNLPDLWNSEDGKKLYTEYIESLRKFCKNPEGSASDKTSGLKKTCKHANLALNDAIKRKLAPESLKPDHLSTGKESPPANLTVPGAGAIQ